MDRLLDVLERSLAPRCHNGMSLAPAPNAGTVALEHNTASEYSTRSAAGESPARWTFRIRGWPIYIAYTAAALTVIFFVGRALKRDLTAIHWSNLHIRADGIALAVACLMAVRLVTAFSCNELFHSLGYRLGLRWLIGALWVSSLARYVPGKMLAGVSAAILIKRRGVALTVAAAVLFLNTAMMLVIGVMLATPLLLSPAMRQRMPGLWVVSIAVIVVGVIALHPRCFTMLCNIVLRRRSLPARPGGKQYVRAVTWLVVRALFLGGALWFTVRTVAPLSVRDYPMILGAMCLAGAIGFLAFFVPAGLGVQEGVFLVVLTPMLGPKAGLVALLFRAAQGISDVLAASAGAVLLHPRVAGVARNSVDRVLPTAGK